MDRQNEDEPALLQSIPRESPLHATVKSALQALRDEAPDPALRALCGDILSGQRNARELLSSSMLDAAVTLGAEQYQEHLRTMDPEERAAFDRATQSYLGEAGERS
ncbi:hypothetical protein [Cellulomonas sp. NPDC089187]|uniref:hypothetical protein n=1 Tax=Cellulomonas sp. NPDC089187 TaxID=3154970 RepID=UPI0034350566